MSSHEIRILKLENLIKEIVTLALFEQSNNAPAPAGAGNAGPVPPQVSAPTDQNQVPKQQQIDLQQSQLMTLDSMIERLNVIRGGKSFTDPEVYGQLVTYFKKITPEQNQIIDQYLRNMAKIMIGARTGDFVFKMETEQPELAQPVVKSPSTAATPTVQNTNVTQPAPVASITSNNTQASG